MKTTQPDLACLQERLAEIEKQNRRLRGAFLALAAGLLAFMAMGAKVAVKDGHFRQITAGKISIIDPAGKEVMTIGSQDGQGTGLRIYNSDGTRIIGLGTTANEKGSGLLVADSTGKPRFGLGLDKGVPSIAMTDENGKKIMAMGGDNTGYGLVIMDGNEIERAGIGFKEGSTGIVIYDAHGQYVRGMVQRADGTHFSSYIDAGGKEVMSK